MDSLYHILCKNENTLKFLSNYFYSKGYIKRKVIVTWCENIYSQYSTLYVYIVCDIKNKHFHVLTRSKHRGLLDCSINGLDFIRKLKFRKINNES